MGEQEELREELIREVGAPACGHPRPAVGCAARGRAPVPGQADRHLPWETDLGDAVVSVTGVNTTRKVWHEPVGVVGAITPWNFPFEVTINKLGQALATGNTVVLKPAPDTPFNATRLGRLIAEKTDIPAGVVSVVTASDHFVGEELTLSPKVDMISFTGSTTVGKRIMEKGAATMKRLFLELGGKSATIVSRGRRLQHGLPARYRRAFPCRPGLRRANTDAAAPFTIRRGRGDIASHLREHPGRGSAGSRHAVRSGDLGQAAVPHPRLHPQGRRRGCHDARRQHRETQAVRQGILGQPNAFHRTWTTR